jgi:copper transport protein
MTVKRFVALLALVGALIVAGASPAFAHATLLTTEPQPGGRFESSPPAVSLRFDEPVEVTLGGIRLFDGNSNRIDIGAPHHPQGSGNQVQSSLPKLDDGTYVVTWRVTSADSHPVQGAFTFQVGTGGAVKNANALAQRLLANQGGSTTVGVVYAVDRVALFAALALFIGGVVFMALVFPAGRESRRGRRLVWWGWAGCLVATLAGIALEGVYAAALPLSKVFETSLWSDVAGTRFGHVTLIRVALLLVAYPLVRMLLPRAKGVPRRLPVWWFAVTGVVLTAIAFTPGLAGHAGTGEYTGFAIPADALHVLAMACWLGGLVLLLAVVLVRTDPEELRDGINRFSAVGLGSVVVLVLTGAFQAWRQVGSWDALRNTDYGKLLIVKLVIFSALIVAASFSREIVNRRFRWYPDDDGEADLEPVREPAVPVPVGGPPGPAVPSGSSDALYHAAPGDRSSGNGGGPPDEWDDWEEDDDETEVRRLRKSAVVEIVIALAVLAVTALLVNAAPARSVQTQPVSMTLKSPKVWMDVVVAPGVAGGNDMHFTALPVGDTVVNVEDMTVQLTRPGSDFPPLDVPLRKFGPGHYIAPLYNIPYPGKWRMTIRATLSATDQEVLTGTFNLR